GLRTPSRTASRRASYQHRCFFLHPTRSTDRSGEALCDTRDFRSPRVRRGRRADELWWQCYGCVPSGGHLYRSDSQRKQARPFSSPPVHESRASHQPKDCQGTRPYPPALAARPRRRGDRMSNCVVGSGGSWLPCSTIAEHSVEGCDHFSHDGDDDDLGFFVGGGEAFVEGFEGGTVTACAEGGHVEDVTDRHPTTIDA